MMAPKSVGLGILESGFFFNENFSRVESAYQGRGDDQPRPLLSV